MLVKFLRSLLCACILAFQVSPVAAWNVHGFPGFAINPATFGIVGFDCTMLPFVNLAKCSQSSQGAATSFAYPGILQAGTNLPNGTITAALAYTANIATNYTGEHVISMPGATIAGGAGKGLQLNANSFRLWGQVYAVSAGTTLSGCNNGNVPPCYWSGTLTISGSSPQVTLDFSAPVSGVSNSLTTPGLIHVSWASGNIINVTTVTVTNVVGSDGNGCGANGQWSLVNQTSAGADLVGTSFPGGCTYTSGGQVFPYNQTASKSVPFTWLSGTTVSGLTSLCIAKLADYNTDNTCNTQAGHIAWRSGFSDDFVSHVATERPAQIRYLNVNNTVFSVGPPAVPMDWASWPTSTAWSYALNVDWWAIPNYFGSASGTNSYTLDCTLLPACTYHLTAGAPADGDFIQFYNVNANTSVNPTITIKDATATSSSPIQVLSQNAIQEFVILGGSPTPTDTVSLTFTTTPLGAFTCLAGGTHTTAAYTVVGGDTIASVTLGLYNIMLADATLAAQPLALLARNAGLASNQFGIGYANNACGLSISANITGSATETIAIGTLAVGGLATNTLYSGIYNKYLNAIVLSAGGGGSSWPWQAQLDLAYDVSVKSGVVVGCWLQPSFWWSTASFTSLTNLANANQCPGGTNFEIQNEVWNSGFTPFGQALYLATSLGFQGDEAEFYVLKQAQFWSIAKSIFGGLAGNLHTISAWQEGGGLAINPFYNGSKLCGQSACANGNQAYDLAVGVNYNSAPNRPQDLIRHLSQAPYGHGAVLNTSYVSAASYASWSAQCTIISNVLNCSSVNSGTIQPNQGIAGCDGTYIRNPTPANFVSGQLTGTITTTLNGAVSDNTHSWVVISTAGIQPGMGVYDATTGMINATVVAVIDGTHLTVGANGTGKTYRSAGSNDTLIFYGGVGTYQLNSTSCSVPSISTVTGGDVLGLQYAADNYCTASGACSTGNAGLGSLQDSFDWITQDLTVASVRNQMDISGSPGAPSFQSLVNTFNAINANAVTLGVTVKDYEAGYDGIPPTTTQATTAGLASGYGYTNSSTFADGFIGIMLVAYKNNVAFKNALIAQHTQELANLPAGSMSQWYVDSSNARWALNPPGGLSAPAPFQSYKAICAINGNPC